MDKSQGVVKVGDKVTFTDTKTNQWLHQWKERKKES